MSRRKILIANVVGARPNFIKIAPLIAELKKEKKFYPILIHTGQHYDKEMSDLFFLDLSLPKPDIYLGVRTSFSCKQVAEIMIKLENYFLKNRPDLVVVVGDVNSTLAGALAAKKLNLSLAHIEAGLRSFDRSMPEEINRILVDAISDYLFTPSLDANLNLKKENIPKEKIFFVGNIMIDSLMKLSKIALKSSILEKLKLEFKEYAVVTLHRPSNVDNKEVLEKILKILKKVGNYFKVVFPMHPRTKNNIIRFGLKKCLESKNLIAISPLGYLDFLCLLVKAKLVLTDSGGIQEETTVLGVPCFTIRENTERPITVKEGTNILVGTSEKKILDGIDKIISGKYKKGKIPKFWDGKTSERIVNIFKKIL